MNKSTVVGMLAIGFTGIASHVLAQTPAPVGYSQAGAPLPATPGGATAASNTGSPAAPGTTPVPAAPGPSLEAALAAAQVAIQTCKGLDQKVGVTVLDSAGIPKVVLASDGASPRGVQSSTNKALTSLAFKAATGELEGRSKAEPEIASRLAANPVFNTHAGGLVITNGSDVIGAVGVGGARGSEKDEACAKAALTKLVGGR
jgi:uncharacterized protein GlcG (DUF336 family)